MANGKQPGPAGYSRQQQTAKTLGTTARSSLSRPGSLNPPTAATSLAWTSGSRTLRGLRVVRKLRSDIRQAAQEFRVPAELVGVIVMHESQAKERRFWQSDWIADQAERAEAAARGDSASIGIGQMQVGLAKALRKLYPALKKGGAVDDLLKPKLAVRYVAAQLAQLQGRLRNFLKSQGVPVTTRQIRDLTALGYNIGWNQLLRKNLQNPRLGTTLAARVQAIRRQSLYLKNTTAYLRLVASRL